MIVWRGAGIAIVIFLVISAWITSYGFESYDLFSERYIGWAMLWASFPTFYLWYILKNKNRNQPEPEDKPGVVHFGSNKYFTGHSLMLIPVIFWGPGLMIGGIYLILENPASRSLSEFSEYVMSHESADDNDESNTKRIINFWNPNETSIDLNVSNEVDESLNREHKIGPKKVVKSSIEVGEYSFNYNDTSHLVKVDTSTSTGENTYNEAWYVFDFDIDLILVHAMAACSSTLREEDIREISWMEKVEERYAGGQLIEPRLNLLNQALEIDICGPGVALPYKTDRYQVIYALVPIPRKIQTSEEYLDSALVSVCF